MEKLECLLCHRLYPLNVFFPFCPECNEPLLFSYPQKRREILLEREGLEKYLDFLPLDRVDRSLSLGEGNTPLIKLTRLSKKLSLSSLLAKNETLNPTHSFKDRGSAVAIQKALSLGLEKIGTVSTGNMAASTAAYGAKAGLKTYVLLKEDTSSEKLLSTAIFNPVLIKVKGDYGKLFSKSYSLSQKLNIYFMNSIDPLRIEGYKITGYEIFLQLERKSPRFIFVPVSSGGHLTGLMRAFIDLKKEGLIKNYPTFVGVQARGCSPLAQAFEKKKLRFTRISKADTLAHAISNPDPPGGNIALKMIREHGGMIVAVSDREILEAQKMLAGEEGIFCQPASATVLAGLLRIKKKFKFKTQDDIILIITGSGLKAVDALDSSRIHVHHTSISNLENVVKSTI
ncbi:MAG: threonine synthase [Candidatus Aminicenantaceae bacterium]